jgi:hypothetical protein
VELVLSKDRRNMLQVRLGLEALNIGWRCKESSMSRWLSGTMRTPMVDEQGRVAN